MTISENNLFVVNDKDLSITINSSVKNANTNEELTSVARYVLVEIANNGELISSEKTLINKNTYIYTVEEDILKDIDNATITVTLYAKTNKKLNSTSISFDVNDSESYDTALISASESYDWNLYYQSSLTIPITLKTLDSDGNKSSFTAIDGIEVIASDGLTYFAKKYGTSGSTYTIEIDKNNVDTGILELELLLKNTNIEYETATISINIRNEDTLTNLVFASSNYSIEVGQVYQVAPQYYPASSAEVYFLSWSSSDTDIVTVSNSGVLVGIADGTATITVKSKYLTKSFTVEVKTYPETIKTTTNITLESLDDYQIEYAILPENAFDKEITFSSSNKTVALVDKNGVISALSAGETIITLKNSYVSTEILVTVLNPLTNIEVGSTAVSLVKDDIYEIPISIPSAYLDLDAEVSYNSSDSEIIYVTEDGMVYAENTGEASVVVTYKGISETIYFTVNKEVSSISLVSGTLTVFDKVHISEIITNYDSTYNYNIYSLDEGVFTVKDGYLIPQKEGSSIITVSLNGLNAIIELEYVNPIDFESVEEYFISNIKEIFLDSISLIKKILTKE